MCAGQDFMSVDPASFRHDGTCKNIYTKINEKWTITKMDLVCELYIQSLVSLNTINEAYYTRL